MSKEQLEQMEHDYKNAFPIDIDWLLEYAKEQTERAGKNTQDFDDMDKQLYSTQKRVQELEDILEQDHRQAVLEDLYAQNKRYREAKEELNRIWEKEYYINTNEYDGGFLDGLDRAIGILEELEGEE